MTLYRIDELKPGQLYRDVLSGRLVLIVKAQAVTPPKSVGYQPGDANAVNGPTVEGLIWNPVYGRHERFEIQDNQLQSINSPWPWS